MKQQINLSYIKNILAPYHYDMDMSQTEFSLFWKSINQNDTRSPYAFTVVMVSLDAYTLRIEGLNERRLQKAIKAGLIEIKSEEELDALKEVVFEGTLDDTERLEMILPFFEEQLVVLSTEPIHSDLYKKALQNINLLVKAANAIDYEG